MINIALVEDNPQYLKVLKSLLDSNSDLYRCDYTYLDAESFLENLQDIDFDIVILDLQLPGMSGVELTYRIRKTLPDTKILICSSYDDDEKLFQSLQNGANGYILKNSTPDQILLAIEDMMSGGAPMSQTIAKKVLEHFYKQGDRKESLRLLTPKENEVLALLSEGLLYKEIADRKGSAMETIKKHCANIYKKLEVNNRTEAVNMYFNN